MRVFAVFAGWLIPLTLARGVPKALERATCINEQLLELDVQETVIYQPVVILTSIESNTVLSLAPGLSLTISNAPTYVQTTLT